MPILAWAYRNNVHALRVACRSELGRSLLEGPMRLIGRYLLWALGGVPQSSPAEARQEFLRLQQALGIKPEARTEGGCTSLCYKSCTLQLKPGDAAVCDTVMTINDEMIRRIGGTMRIVERLTDVGGKQCQVVIE